MKKMICLLVLLLMPILSQAGVMNGGGGKGVLCVSNSVGIRSTLEVLDLYEAKHIFNLRPDGKNQSFAEEMQFFGDRLNSFYREPNEIAEPINFLDRDSIRKQLGDLFVPIPPGSRLPLTDDATLPIVPPHCQIVQIAIYNNLGLQVDMDYWGQLDARNQAALILHELIYLNSRNHGASHSDETRKFVGRLFSTTPPTPKFVTQGSGYFQCGAGGARDESVFDFILVPKNSSQLEATEWIANFRVIDGVSPLSRVVAEIPKITSEMSEMEINTPLHAELYHETRSIRIHLKNRGGHILLQASIYDTKTNSISPDSQGSCRWEKF